MVKRAKHLLGITALVLALMQPCLAIVLRPVTFDELVARATHISVSTVERIDSFWEGGRILSHVSLVIEQPVKGAEQRLDVLVPGGVIDGLGQWVPGGPRFQIGQRGLYFLEPMGVREGFRLVGFTQGQILPTGTSAKKYERWNERLKRLFLPSQMHDVRSTQ